MLRLHHFPLSPFCRKVRLALEEKRLRFETIAVRPWEAPVEPLQSGLLSGVTSLTLDSGETLRDARAIACLVRALKELTVLDGLGAMPETIRMRIAR